MPTLTITRGLPGSGKTTWAKKQDAVRVNRDDIRLELFGPDYRIPVRECEDRVSVIQEERIEKALEKGLDVIADDTNLRKSPPQFFQTYHLKKTFGLDDDLLLRVVEFHVPMHTCIERDALRENPVGREVIFGLVRRHYGHGGMRPWFQMKHIEMTRLRG